MLDGPWNEDAGQIHIETSEQMLETESAARERFSMWGGRFSHGSDPVGFADRYAKAAGIVPS
jgi:hypothetical protein